MFGLILPAEAMPWVSLALLAAMFTLFVLEVIPVEVTGPMPEAGTPLTDAAGAEVGEMRSGRAGRGIALLRIDALDRAPFAAGAASVAPRVPAWMRLSAQEQA